MKILQPSVLIPIGELDDRFLRRLERYGRICYKSEDRITSESSENFILTNIIYRGHESVIEHEKVTVIVTCDRGVSHEIVRHRIGSYSQESTRFCNYSKGKFDGEISVIEPFELVQYKNQLSESYHLENDPYGIWYASCVMAETCYLKLLALGIKPEWARSVLPNSLKTEIVISYNLREWRHFFRLRTAPAAHPQMRQWTIPLLLEFKRWIPILFEDIEWDTKFDSNKYAKIEYE